jgi:hypothetical protein
MNVMGLAVAQEDGCCKIAISLIDPISECLPRNCELQDGHTISSKLPLRISAGSITRPHVGQTVFITARKWEQSLECVRKGIMRYQSSVMIGNVPVISVAFGPDAQSNQNRGRAVGLLAVGDVAVGIIAVGAIAAGVIAVGGLGFGVVSVGGLALGLVALGGVAVGGVAVGGLAAGFRSLGGLAIGPHPDGGLRVYWPPS